ncbi:MAG: right-handed parallel beta-helix repeat-containing protein [Parasporobacterium sp.]|nr:right-handed parallel beta-helix repeat-containing protein [Parasporobacterium sp.]
MKTLKWLICVGILAAAAAGCVYADEYRVSPGSLTRTVTDAKDGDVIILSEGVYDETNESFPIVLTSSVTLCAAEGESPVIDAPAFVPAVRIEADGVTITDLDIRFRRTGLYALGDDMTVENCRISLADPAWRTSSCGVWTGGIYRAAFRSCDFTECGIALAGPPVSESSKNIPVLTGLFEVGEDAGYFTSHEITDCTVNGKTLFYAVNQESVTAPSDAGLILIANCSNVVIEDTDVSYSSMGMEIAYCDHVSVERCKADCCGVFGIYLAKNSSGELVECSSEGTNHGLDIRASSDISLIGCRADKCDQGLFFSKVERGLMIDCKVSSTGQGYFMAGGSQCQIRNCEAIECENGFNIQKENDVLITGCFLKENTICAARLDGSDVIFSGNTMEDNWVSIMAYGNVNFNITDNVIKNSGSCGLYLRDIAFSRISGNTIDGSANNSVEACGEMSGTLLADNVIDKEIVLNDGAVFRIIQ